jgi:hypothetical protein
MKIFCYNTHTQAKKKLDGKYLTQEYENPKGFSASNDGDKDCISAERERGGKTERERERERERVCECVLEEAVVSSLYNRCR